MTRRRRVPPTLRVCIGVFVLLFGTVIADTTKDSPVNPEKQFSLDASERSTYERNKTIPNKIPSRDESDLVSIEKKKDPVALYNSTKKDIETVNDERTKITEVEEEEKVPMPIDELHESQEIRSREQFHRLSTADSADGGSKLEEIIYGTPGKSSSTKTLSDDTYRHSRTNDLTMITTKPVLEELKFDERKNVTEAKLEGSKASEDGFELKGKRETDTKTEMENSSKAGASLRLEMINAKNDSTGQKIELAEEFQERRKKSENPVKNSEVSDLKGADENGSISLINDTYVNYSHHNKTFAARDLERNQSRATENATNFISEENAVTHRDPKEEVEVVGNVTNSTVLRIIESQSQIASTKDAIESSQRSNQKEDTLNNFTKVTEVGQSEVENGNEQKLSQVTTEETIRKESSIQGSSSPVPRGRTIALSGVNKFSDFSETKPTITSKLDVSFSKKNITDKPYPYAIRNSGNQGDTTTEEASALENTIGRGQSEEKFIVTEASDVLENSIQQFKPSHHEKLTNESSIVSSTEIPNSTPMTTASLLRLEERNSTNITDKSIDPRETSKQEEKSTSAGNDVPRWSENRETITGKGNFDVTGNGITEVNPKPETVPFQEITTRTTPNALATEFAEPQTDGTPTNIDVETNVEGSSLIRSTLNVTEASTEYSLIKGSFSDKETSTLTPVTSTVKTIDIGTTIEETFLGNVTEPPAASEPNGTNEILSGVSATFSPDESLPTTTSVEFEFVGLSESTTYHRRNVTEEAAEGRETSNEGPILTPAVQDSMTRNETTKASDESTTETTNIDDGASTIPVIDETTVPTSMPGVTQSNEVTTRPSVAEEIDQSSTKESETQKTNDVMGPWSTTTEDAPTTIRTEQTISSSSKDSSSMGNVTESPVEFTTMSDVNATDATRVVTSVPFVPTGLQPRTPISSSTGEPSASNVPTARTDDTKVSPTSEEITSLVRIDMEGSWYEVCPKMDKLKETLAEILTDGMKKAVSDKQIRFHQDPCQESPGSTPTSSETPLMSILIYVVDENGKFDSTMTKKLPSLYEDSEERYKFPIKIHRFLLVQETKSIPDSGNAIAVVVVSSIAFICLVLLAGLLFIMRKRQTRFNYGERCRPVSLDAYSLDSVSAYNSVRRKGVARSSKRSYGNPTFEDSSAIPSHPLNFAGLSTFCNDVNAINEEFAGIPQVSAKIDELPAGAEVKNRYANVIPLPETRVPLQKINNDPLTEYINASYVRGPKNATRYYIACQAPMESTVTDFWRMIWEQQSKVIIMLTDLVENGVEKCTEYVPPSELTDCHRLYGDFQVTLKKRETKEKYAISTLHLKNLENNTFREVYHIWYLWPVDGVQSDGAGLIAVLLEARALQRGGPGPIVVHCSPGTGRTGTLIALDLGIRQYEITRTVDVPRVVYTIRRDRAGAVQTKEQYAFIHKALNLYATKLAGGVLEST